MNNSFNKSRRKFLTTTGSGIIAVAAGSTSAITTVSAQEQEEDWPYGYEWGIDANMPIDMAMTTDLVVTYEIDDLNGQTLLVARDIETGTVEWQESFPETYFHGSGLALGDNAVFAGGEGGFARIDLETGSRDWTYNIRYTSGEPEYHDGSVFVSLRTENKGSDDLVSIDASTGDLNWQTELSGSTWGSPAVIEDTVYYGRNGYQMSDGEILFDIDYGGNETRYERLGDVLILTSWEEEEGEPNMFSIEPGTSSIEWAQNIVGNVFAEPIRVSDTLYIGTRGRSVYSIDIDSGNILWESENVGQISEQVVYNNGTVFVATVHGDLYGLDSETGEAEWEVRLTTDTSRIRSFQSINDDLIISQDYVSGPDGVDRYVIPGSVSRVSSDAESLPSLEITKNIETPNVNGEIRFRAETDNAQESTFYWSIWNNDSDDDSQNLHQGTGTEQTYVPDQTGEHSVICVLIDQQRPVITSISESIEVSNRGTSSPTTFFEQTQNVAENTLVFAGLGAAAIGLGYTAYRRIGSDSTESGPTDESQQTTETTNNQTSDHKSAETITIDSYAALTLGGEIASDRSFSIQLGTVSHNTVWVIIPDTGETISAEKATEFVDRITPWSRMDTHPNLVAVYGSGNDPLPWAALEQADYPELTDRVDSMSINETCNVLQQVCETLHHVYRHGTGYENLTTESILYTDDNEVKLRGILDQFANSDPWYNAPEEFDGESTEQSTVYRIGLIAYELFTGTIPYKLYPDGIPRETIQSAERSSPSEQVDDIPAELESIIMKALSKSPDDRYETVLHLRDEFNSLDIS